MFFFVDCYEMIIPHHLSIRQKSMDLTEWVAERKNEHFMFSLNSNVEKKTSKIKWILLFTTNSFHFNHKFEYIRFYISIKQRLIWEELNFMHNVLVFGVSDSYRTDFLTTMFVFSVLFSLRFESISLYCWSRIMKLFINTVKHYRMSNVLKAYAICFT